MKNIKSYRQFIHENRLRKNIEDMSSILESYDIYNGLDADEIIEYSSLEDTNEGFLSSLRDKIKSLISKKSDVEGEGSQKKKEVLQNKIESMEDKIAAAKEKFQKEKESIEKEGFTETDEDRYYDAEDKGWPPTKTVNTPEGNKKYYILGKEKAREMFDASVKKWKSKGGVRWQPKDGEGDVPNKKDYEEISEPINTPSGNTIFYVVKGSGGKKNIGDEVQKYEEKINDLQNKIKEINKKIEDEYGGDGSDPRSKKAMDAIENLSQAISKLKAERDKISEE